MPGPLKELYEERFALSKDALKTLVKNIKTKLPKDLILNLTNSGYKIDV